jgi:hypothetical protein
MTIDQATRRTDGFDQGSHWIALADGQRWGFPRPWLEVRAAFNGGKPVGTCAVVTYGHATDQLLAAIGACDDAAARICGAATLAAALLRLNYELLDAELDGLLAFRRGDPASLAWVGAVLEVATGAMGRRTGGGS